jgi:thioredoxin reductase (NADPH)
MAKPVILSVDDDPQVLSAVSRDLRRRYGDHYRVLRSDSSFLETRAESQKGCRVDSIGRCNT